MLARMPPVVSRPSVAPRDPTTRGRLAILSCLLVLVAAACGSIPGSEVEAPRGKQFIPMVPDSIDDVGLAPSVTIDDQGLPSISYFGFPAELKEGEIPVARPVGSPFLQTDEAEDAGAVLLASLTPEQIWTRGAIAQPRESPAGVPVPFGPAAEPSLATLTPARARGTDIVIAGADVHATWTADTGVWYGVGPSPFEVEAVQETREAGAPSVTVDAAGAPIVAYTVAGAEPEVRVAERVGDRWEVTSIATLSRCGRGCPPATHVALLGEEPIVVVADPLSGEVIAAQRQGEAWVTEVVATGATGGASLATAGDTAAIAFYTPSGVAVATGRFGSWSVEDVATFAETSGEQTETPTVPTQPGTGIAIDGQGAIWVTWQDGAGIHLASSADGQFDEIELSQTRGGVNPSVAVTEDGASVYLAWYDPEEGDLRLGTYGEIPGLLIAAPSPLPAPAPPPIGGTCEPEGTSLEVTAQGIAFDTNCLAAPADQPFEILFNNEDPDSHNVAIYTDVSVTETLFKGEIFPGPDDRTYRVDPIPAGDYFFQCDVHPSQMTGTFVVAEESGGDGGGNGGGGNGGGGG